MTALREAVRFNLPAGATVVVVTESERELLTFEDAVRAWHFVPTAIGVYADPHPKDGREMIIELEALRSKGAQYLLFPRRTLRWLDHYEDLRRHLERRYRLVLGDPSTCVIYALYDLPDVQFRSRGAPDGLSVPPPEMIALVTGQYDSEGFYYNGLKGANSICDILSGHQIDIDSFGAVLDFGCGCGRIMRHWRTLTGPALFGSDYNPYLVRWCHDALPFASFEANHLADKLGYADASFDFIYAISIFTHLDVALQHFWLAELRRILKPAGTLLLTVHGTTRLDELLSEEKESFLAGEMIVRGGQMSGSNLCVTFHPEEYIRRNFTNGLEMKDFIPGGAKDANQDAVLFVKRPDHLRKPSE